MRVAVVGATGFSGSHICVELLQRGHNVTGMSRNPEKLGKHERYNPVSHDLAAAAIADIVKVFEGHDVLVNAYNGPQDYKGFVETTRKIILASKAANISYFIMIGGTGSLSIPGEPYVTAADSRQWWLAYRRNMVDTKAGLSFAEQRFGPGPITDSTKAYSKARKALYEGTASEDDKELIKNTEDPVLYGENWINDIPVAARATFMMCDGNTSFDWSFVSPPSGFVGGPKTGKYEVWVDEVPMLEKAKRESLDGNPYEGRLLGITAADLAVAVVDEAEKKLNAGKHWSPVGEWENDGSHPITVTL